MKNTPFIVSLALSLALTTLAGGCYNPKVQQENANALALEVDRYRVDQQNRIDELNRQYRFQFEHIITDLAATEQAASDHDFSLAVQKVADEMLASWETQTLPRHFRDLLFDGVEQQRARMRAADEAIAAARNAFADAYKELTLDMGQLKTVKGKLDALATKEDRIRTAAQFIQTTAKIYQDLQKKAESKQSGKS